MGSFVLFILSVLIGIYAFKTHRRLESAQRDLYRYKHLTSQEKYQDKLSLEIKSKESQRLYLAGEEARLKTSIELLSKKLSELKEEEFVESYGFYQPKYDFIASGSYESLLKKNREKQKEMVKRKTAAVCHSEWSVGNSKKEGERMVKNFLKLVLTIFNNECDASISRLKYSSNVESAEAKIRKLFERLNRNSRVIHCEITDNYLELKIKQLHLQYQIETEKYENSEREKAIKAEAKERKKIDELMKKAEEAEEQEKRFQQELENKLKEKELGYGVERGKLEIQIQQLKQKIEEAKNVKEKANEEAALTKAGHIYVVSNLGSLGRNMYRIWMTKSGDPDKTIDIMSRAVPFPFDVHLKFISEEATDTMSRLRTAFSDRNVNKVNEQRGFFNVSLDEIIQVVTGIKEDTGAIKSIHVDRAPSAYEYRRTQAIENNIVDRTTQSTDSKEEFRGTA